MSAGKAQSCTVDWPATEGHGLKGFRFNSRVYLGLDFVKKDPVIIAKMIDISEAATTTKEDKLSH